MPGIDEVSSNWSVYRVRCPFSARASILKQCHFPPLLYSRTESRSRLVGQSRVLYRSPSMERGAVLSIATQWPSPLEVRALPHLRLRAFPTDMSKCSTWRIASSVCQTLEPATSECQSRVWFKLSLMDTDAEAFLWYMWFRSNLDFKFFTFYISVTKIWNLKYEFISDIVQSKTI